eukprot:CAMPEP_0197527722 /NCGR_PEP_ID=MMETSP1318-20131121/22627_1 /TAXON_ID=552666 /ORGANISM="Partenskyella glossopodia, Strain RCC365" /LENGTH=433 /DNA_ID=CAMNT_0043082507 /DNA_START=338 /DNA_END=1639 /DNA_ORIENTATION=-
MMRSTYKGNIELVVLDRSEKQSPYLSKVNLTNYDSKTTAKRELRYIHSPEPVEKIRIGAERNCLSLMARNDIVINTDADDIYMPGYVRAVVEELIREDIQNVMVEGCNTIPTVKINATGSIQKSDIYLLQKETFGIEEDDLPLTIEQIRERDYGECGAKCVGYAFAMPRFLIAKGEGLSVGLPESEDKLPRFEIMLGEDNICVSCVESETDPSLPIARYRADLPTGEESFMENFLYLSAQGLVADIRETIERCKQSVFGKVRNYCNAIEENYFSFGQGNEPRFFASDEEIENKTLVNPGIAGLPVTNDDGSPLLIKTDSDMGITRTFWFKAKLGNVEKIETEEMMNNYLALAHYIVARSSGQDGKTDVDFYSVGGSEDVDGNVKVMEGLKAYWCNVLGDEERDYLIQLIYGEKSSLAGLANLRESVVQDLCAA